MTTLDTVNFKLKEFILHHGNDNEAIELLKENITTSKPKLKDSFFLEEFNNFTQLLIYRNRISDKMNINKNNKPSIFSKEGLNEITKDLYYSTIIGMIKQIRDVYSKCGAKSPNGKFVPYDPINSNYDPDLIENFFISKEIYSEQYYIKNLDIIWGIKNLDQYINQYDSIPKKGNSEYPLLDFFFENYFKKGKFFNNTIKKILSKNELDKYDKDVCDKSLEDTKSFTNNFFEGLTVLEIKNISKNLMDILKSKENEYKNLKKVFFDLQAKNKSIQEYCETQINNIKNKIGKVNDSQANIWTVLQKNYSVQLNLHKNLFQN
jgi:hypothetical protein